MLGLAVVAVMVDVPSPFKPWALCAVIAAAGVITTVIERSNYLGAVADLRTEQADRARDVAAAEKAVRDAMQQDAERSAGIIASLRNDTRSLEERLDAARTSMVKVPVFVTPKGCPDVMSSPAVRSFIDGLPDVYDGQTGAGKQAGPRGAEGALPKKAAAPGRVP